MHYSTYVIYEDMRITDENKDYILKEIERRFCEDYCYTENEETVYDYCDWFTIGGRWMNGIKSKNPGKGVKGDVSYTLSEFEDLQVKVMKATNTEYDIVNVEDISESIDEPYAIIVNGESPVERELWDVEKKSFIPNKEFTRLFKKLKNHEFEGLVVNIDCHN